MTVESALFFKDGHIDYWTHKSLAEARKYCRTRYTENDQVDRWQVAISDDGDVVHYSQPAHEKR